MNWENIIKITPWTPKCPHCGIPMETLKSKRHKWSGSHKVKRDSAIFECPKCGHKERL
tara:strand:- start:1308 stop:1481 length:174 start_codon:yes stop_codon:yes gene_type:complete